MRVFLAVQVLSSSVANALHFLEFDLQDPAFKNASGSAKFCKIFNDMFDMLNTKNKFTKTPKRKSITIKDLSEVKRKIDEYIDYINKLEVEVRLRKKKTLLI